MVCFKTNIFQKESRSHEKKRVASARKLMLLEAVEKHAGFGAWAHHIPGNKRACSRRPGRERGNENLSCRRQDDQRQMDATGPLIHCVVWNDGEHNRVALDTSDMHPSGSDEVGANYHH